MDWLSQTAIIIGMFGLRLGVPLAITLLVGYWLRRLDAKWQAEAQARLAAGQTQQKATEEAELEMYRLLEQPCWLFKDCPSSLRLHCPAYRENHDTPCWLARYRAERAIPTECYRCKRFSQRQAEKYFC